MYHSHTDRKSLTSHRLTGDILVCTNHQCDTFHQQYIQSRSKNHSILKTECKLLKTKALQAVFEQLLLLNSCLTNEERLQRDDGDDESINKLSLWIAQAILPDGRMILNDDSAKGQCCPSSEACANLPQIHCQRSAREPFISHATKEFLACHV